MKTTVIIPNYNGREYLKNCLDSLKEIIDESFETIVVDNGSKDNSLFMLEQEYTWVRTIALNENTGFAAAVNRGIEASNTEYVILLNNDTRVERGFVTELERPLDEDKKVFSASARMVRMDNPAILDGAGDYFTILGWAYARGKGKELGSKFNKPRNIFSACGGAAIYRREALLAMGGFDEAHFAYLEDVDVGYRGKILGYKNVYAPASVCLHVGSGSSGSRYNEFKVKLSSRNNVYMVMKNMPLLQLLINLPFLLLGYIIKTIFFVKKGFGKIYVSGLISGISLYFSEEGHRKKVGFKLKNLGNYIHIELELIANILGLL